MGAIRYEDELPVDITDQQYDAWFKSSYVFEGVRMGPWPIPEMKGCPFCGREPHLTSRAATESERSTTGEIHFVSCCCGGCASRAWQTGYSLAEVQAAWNRRYTSVIVDDHDEPPFDAETERSAASIRWLKWYRTKHRATLAVARQAYNDKKSSMSVAQ